MGLKNKWQMGPSGNSALLFLVFVCSGQVFRPAKGDVLIWHANLLHGGSVMVDPEKTRKSMVAHYYAEGVLCYHEISQRPAILRR